MSASDYTSRLRAFLSSTKRQNSLKGLRENVARAFAVSPFDLNEVTVNMPEREDSTESLKRVFAKFKESLPDGRFPFSDTMILGDFTMEPRTLTLSADDPFDRVLMDIVETNRRKRRDYAHDGDAFSNFRQTSQLLGLEGFGPAESALFNVLQKVARLQSLRANGRMHDTANEAAEDTFLDLAVYAIISYAIYKEQTSD